MKLTKPQKELLHRWHKNPTQPIFNEVLYFAQTKRLPKTLSDETVFIMGDGWYKPNLNNEEVASYFEANWGEIEINLLPKGKPNRTKIYPQGGLDRKRTMVYEDGIIANVSRETMHEVTGGHQGVCKSYTPLSEWKKVNRNERVMAYNGYNDYGCTVTFDTKQNYTLKITYHTKPFNLSDYHFHLSAFMRKQPKASEIDAFVKTMSAIFKPKDVLEYLLVNCKTNE